MKTWIHAVGAALKWVWRTFGKPAVDNPKTPQDESDAFDPLVEKVIDELVELALKKAKEKKVPVAPMDVAKEAVKRFPRLTTKEALDRVNAALGRKSGS